MPACPARSDRGKERDLLVSRPKTRNAFVVVVSGLAYPFLIGAAITCIFYALVYRGPLNVPFMHRYFTANPVLFAEAYLFFVGLASLMLKLLDVVGQFVTLPMVTLGDIPAAGQQPEEAGPLFEQLSRLPAAARNSYLGRRLLDALQFVQRKGTAAGLTDELKYLADMDAVRQQDSLGLVRIAIWATPMLGFLGTVIGITQALGHLDTKALATDYQGTMEAMLAGLHVKFDSTALALTLSTLMMFLQFLMDRVETQLLSTVDLRANEQLVGRFQDTGISSHEPHLAVIEQMGRAVVQTTETLVARQTQLWQATIEAAHQQWSQLMPAAGQVLQSSLGTALEQSLQQFAGALTQSEREAAAQTRAQWEQWQTVLAENSRRLQTQQEEMTRQGELLAQVVQVTGDVMTLERSLNENLKALAGTKDFEDLVLSLTAAIHLLTTRLGTAPGTPQVELKDIRTKGRAA
jgi:hypothetical protein